MTDVSVASVSRVSGLGVVGECGRVVGVVVGGWCSRMVAWSLVSVAVLCWAMAWNVGRGVLAASGRGAVDSVAMMSDPGVLVLMWSKGGVGAVLVLMVLSITRAYEGGVEQVERLAVPRAWVWPVSRWLVGALVAGVGTMLVTPATWHVAHMAGVAQGLDAQRWAMAGRLALGVVLLSVLVAGFAAAVRSSAVTLSVMGLWFVLGEELLRINSLTHGVAQWLPLANLWHFVGFEMSSTVVPAWSAMTSGVWLASMALVMGGLGVARSVRS